MSIEPTEEMLRAWEAWDRKIPGPDTRTPFFAGWRAREEARNLAKARWLESQAHAKTVGKLRGHTSEEAEAREIPGVKSITGLVCAAEPFEAALLDKFPPRFSWRCLLGFHKWEADAWSGYDGRCCSRCGEIDD